MVSKGRPFRLFSDSDSDQDTKSGFSDDHELPFIFRQPDMASENKKLMAEMTKALEADPTVDLSSLLPLSYRRIQKSRFLTSTGASKLTRINQNTLGDIEYMLDDDPEACILTKRDLELYTYWRELEGGKDRPPVPRESTLDDLRKSISGTQTATIVCPLSEELQYLLETRIRDFSVEDPQSLARAVIHLLLDAEKIDQNGSNRIILKCSGKIAAKLRYHPGKWQEYETMEYVRDRAPGVPCPRTHGLVKLRNYQVMFMDYISSMTLEKAWSTLPIEERLSIQSQLETILLALRALRQEDGQPLGTVGEEHICDDTRSLRTWSSTKVLCTAREFQEFQFAQWQPVTKTFPKLYHSLQPPLADGSVFTHGDFRPANIMVDFNEEGKCIVTSIIDWENSGYYPDYFECTKATCLLMIRKEDDWYEYLPPCISPAKFAHRWIWDFFLDRFLRQRHNAIA